MAGLNVQTFQRANVQTLMIKGFLNLPWFAWAGLALIVAAIYYFVWPQKAVTVSMGFRFLVIRYAHTLTWILLAINFLLRGLSPSFNGIANLLAATGALVYFFFLVMTFVVR